MGQVKQFADIGGEEGEAADVEAFVFSLHAGIVTGTFPAQGSQLIDCGDEADVLEFVDQFIVEGDSGLSDGFE